MKNGPIFEWIPGNIILYEQNYKEYFDNLIHDLKHHHNDDNNIDCVQDNSDEDDDSLGSWEAECAEMDEEEGVIATYDNIVEGREISDHEYTRDES